MQWIADLQHTSHILKLLQQKKNHQHNKHKQILKFVPRKANMSQLDKMCTAGIPRCFCKSRPHRRRKIPSLCIRRCTEEQDVELWLELMLLWLLSWWPQQAVELAVDQALNRCIL